MLAAPDPDETRVVRFESRVRGMVLGLALGDGLLRPSGDGRLLGTATTQLAAFTAEGLIRAIVRQDHRGICHEPSVIWHAMLRWARLQQIDGTPPPVGSTDGWLATVPVLRERRGSAPAVVAGIRAHRGSLSPQPVTTTSRGHHALTRLVALAVGADGRGTTPAVRIAQECAAATHGHPAIAGEVRSGIEVLGLALRSEGLESWRDAVRTVPDVEDDVLHALDGTVADAPALSARAALLGAVARISRGEGIPRAEGVGPFTGALLGALRGVEALPADIWRLELGHVVDTLARDLAVQVTRPRDGSEWHEPLDAHWASRYPGW